MNAHTPGQWTVSDTSIVCGDICIAVIEDDGGYEAPAEKRQANARLIAAAPELLEALEAVMTRASLDPSHLHKFGKEYQQAKCAILKATEGK